MNVAKILEYQKIDSEKFELECRLKNSDEYGKYCMLNKKKEGLIGEIIAYAEECQKIYDGMDKDVRQYESIGRDIAKINDNIADIDEPKQADEYEKKLQKMLKLLENIELGTSRVQRNLDRIKSASEKKMKEFKLCCNNLMASKNDLDKLKTQLQTEVKAINAKLNAMKDALDDAMLSKYNAVRKSGKWPVVEEYNAENKSGGVCGMDIPIELINRLKDVERLPECPNCGRLLYVKK